MKYNVKYNWYGEQDKYTVSISYKSDTKTYAVKNKSFGLSSEYYGKVVCEVIDNGNGIIVGVEDSTFHLDYAQEQYLLTALLVRAKEDYCKVKIKEKN